MNITTIGHAGLWVETKDLKILCDPWHFNNPSFFNTWHVYPDNSNVNWDKILKETDIVFVSHVHRDHFDEKLLTLLLEKNKDVKVLLPDFRFCVLKDDFKKIGFKNFIIKEYKKGDTTVVTYPSETIDREREDCSICINDKNKTFLNFNDSAITPEHKKNILNRFQKIDWAAGQFSGANWWPTCYKYDDNEKIELITSYRTRKIEHYKRMIDYLGVEKMIPIAGPPCFLQKNLDHLNYRENKKSIFFDSWDVPEFNTMDKVFRTIPGDSYTFETIKDIKKRPFDKEKFIIENSYFYNYNISNNKLKYIDKNFIGFFQKILSENKWLKKYIKLKIFIEVDNFKTYCLDFKKGEVKEIFDNIRKGAYYIINFKQKVVYDLLEKNITDWELGFLSCTCTFERKPDLYNPWILSFFRNLNTERLQKIYNITKSNEVLEGKMIVGDYEINRYCPHQHYDLMHHSEIDLEKGTIKCLGHGWKWDLETCEGINCSAKIICNRVIQKT